MSTGQAATQAMQVVHSQSVWEAMTWSTRGCSSLPSHLRLGAMRLLPLGMVLQVHDEVPGIQKLVRGVGRARLLAPTTLDAGEEVQPVRPGEVLQAIPPVGFTTLEVQLRLEVQRIHLLVVLQLLEDRVHRRPENVEVLGGRDVGQEPEGDHQVGVPPVLRHQPGAVMLSQVRHRDEPDDPQHDPRLHRVVGQVAGPEDEAAERQHADPHEDRHRERVHHRQERIRGGDQEPLSSGDELHQEVQRGYGECQKSPEDEGVSPPRRQALADLGLPQHLGEEDSDPAPHVIAAILGTAPAHEPDLVPEQPGEDRQGSHEVDAYEEANDSMKAHSSHRWLVRGPDQVEETGPQDERDLPTTRRVYVHPIDRPRALSARQEG